METNEQIERLRNAVEQAAGCKMQGHKDFVFLSDAIFQRTRQTIGVNTLKRLWGQLEEETTPRLSTLNILAQYVGFDDWDSFVTSSKITPPTNPRIHLKSKPRSLLLTTTLNSIRVKTPLLKSLSVRPLAESLSSFWPLLPCLSLS
jgi:hypothetical protein